MLGHISLFLAHLSVRRLEKNFSMVRRTALKWLVLFALCSPYGLQCSAYQGYFAVHRD